MLNTNFYKNFFNLKIYYLLNLGCNYYLKSLYLNMQLFLLKLLLLFDKINNLFLSCCLTFYKFNNILNEFYQQI